MTTRTPETCPGDCSMRCPVCARRFWVWCENYSRRFERPRKERRAAREVPDLVERA